MQRSKFVKVEDFAKEFDLSRNLIDVSRHNDKMPKHTFKTGERGETLIDKNYYVRRKNFQLKIINRCHDMYYELSEDFCDNELSKLMYILNGDKKTISGWSTFISNNLFMLPPREVHLNRIRESVWLFYNTMKCFLPRWRKAKYQKRKRLKRFLKLVKNSKKKTNSKK